jgi:hypothetical protein
MLYISDAKLDGKDIEPMLRHSRRVDCGGTPKNDRRSALKAYEQTATKAAKS